MDHSRWRSDRLHRARLPLGEWSPRAYAAFGDGPARCESFNERFRDELLNGEIFYTLKEAQVIIEQWRKHYNTKRPHSALGYRPPAPENIITMDQRPPMH